tara:strand:+ start:72 stop:677 length:606 start_codon:yes stop_codon:yes gene_type:complete
MIPQLTDVYVKNILEVYSMADMQDIQSGMDWYQDAYDICQEIADKHELPLHIVAGVLSALSPTNKWGQNVKDADSMCALFVSGGYVEDCKPCTYKAMRDKAWSILQTMPRDEEAVAFILKGPKITDFFRCIMKTDICVIDGHAWCIANLDRRTMQEVPFIGKTLRKDLQEAYGIAGDKHNIKSYEMQAITWLAWRVHHGIV